MHLVGLALENYRQFEKVNVDFVDGVTGIIGLNGAGKSSLVEAIAWALYGNVAARTVKENIKRDTAGPGEDVMATLRWEMQGQAYEVIRKLKGEKMSPDVKFLVNGELQAHSSKAVQSSIERTLGLDWQAFYTSFFARQKELNALSDLNAAARKDLILRMLKIDAVDSALAFAKDEAKELKVKKEMLGQRVEQLPEIEKKYKESSDKLKALQKELKEKEKKYKSVEKKFQTIDKEHRAEKKKAKEFQAKNYELKELASRAEQENKYLSAAEAGIKNLKLDEGELKLLEGEQKKQGQEGSKLQKRTEKLRSELTELETKRELYRGQYQELNKKEKELLGLGPKAKCPTCQRPLGSDMEGIEKHFAAEKKDLKQKGVMLSDKIKEKQLEAVQLTKELKEQEQKEKQLSKDIRGKLEIKGKQEQLLAQIKVIKQNIVKITPKLRELEQEVKSIDFAEKEFNKLEKDHEHAFAEHQAAKEQFQKDNFAEQLQSKEVEQLSGQLAGIAKDQAEMQKINLDFESIQQLIKIFGDFRVYLISKIRPSLAQIAGRLFNQMTQGKYSGLELDEDYEILIEDEGKKYPVDRFSGGEIDLVNLCLRLAISQYVTEQYGAEMYFIVLDEIFGSQDNLRKNSILEALTALNKQFRQIFLITHVEEVKDVVGQVIQVEENEEGVSCVKV